MWNGDLALVDQILAPKFNIEFGAVITEPDPSEIATACGHDALRRL
jgi:hypothetical protein